MQFLARDVDENGSMQLVVEPPHDRLGEALDASFVPVRLGCVPVGGVEDPEQVDSVPGVEVRVSPCVCELVNERPPAVQI